MRFAVEVRRVGNEILPLLVLGLTSMCLVGGMAFAVQAPDTATSIQRTSWVVLLVLGGGILSVLGITLARGRPYEATASVEDGSLVLDAGGRTQRVKAKARYLYVLRDGDRWGIEIERYTGALRLLLADRDQAERLAGALVGEERREAAAYRLRKKADYYRFVLNIFCWMFLFSGLVFLPYVPVVGTFFVLAFLPMAVWTTLHAVPMVVIASPRGVALIDPFRVREFPLETIEACKVVDDDAVRFYFTDGTSLRLSELSAHPRDREAKTSEPAAEKLEERLGGLLAKERPAA